MLTHESKAEVVTSVFGGLLGGADPPGGHLPRGMPGPSIASATTPEVFLPDRAWVPLSHSGCGDLPPCR